MNLKTIVVDYLRKSADAIEANTCELSTEEYMELLKVISHTPLSKELACRHLNMSRSTFDAKVRNGELPKGQKRLGFKELIWYRDELDNL